MTNPYCLWLRSSYSITGTDQEARYEKCREGEKIFLGFLFFVSLLTFLSGVIQTVSAAQQRSVVDVTT
jgi:hypothetical protein